MTQININKLENIEFTFKEKLKNFYISLKELFRKKWSPSYSFNLIRKGKLIGHRRAAIAFSTYIDKLKNINQEDLVHDFMKFYTEHWEISRSSWTQDVFAMYCENRFNLNKKWHLKYLEVGGWDGITSSNTISLKVERGWTGILIEAEPYSFYKMALMRKSDKLINAAIVPSGFKSKKVKLLKSDALSGIEGGEGEFGHLDKETKKHPSFKQSSDNYFMVKTININSLLKNEVIDYFSLDIEGLEFEIIKDLKWKEINKPKIMTIEHNGIKEKKLAINELLTKEGYAEMFSEHSWLTKGDSWFVLSEII